LPVRVVAEVLPEKRRVELVLEQGTVGELLDKLGLGREGAVVVRDGVPLVEEEVLRDGERVVVYRAASGG
jgi:sulfur carrier protein